VNSNKYHIPKPNQIFFEWVSLPWYPFEQVWIFSVEHDQPRDKNRKDQDEGKESDHENPLPAGNVGKVILLLPVFSPGTSSAPPPFWGFIRIW
jgi:hypothetical protein